MLSLIFSHRVCVGRWAEQAKQQKSNRQCKATVGVLLLEGRTAVNIDFCEEQIQARFVHGNLAVADDLSRRSPQAKLLSNCSPVVTCSFERSPFFVSCLFVEQAREHAHARIV